MNTTGFLEPRWVVLVVIGLLFAVVDYKVGQTFSPYYHNHRHSISNTVSNYQRNTRGSFDQSQNPSR